MDNIKKKRTNALNGIMPEGFSGFQNFLARKKVVVNC